MSDYASCRKPEFLRELRLGLVVYGGVLLAIYMNGICQEFYHAVRGRGIYKLMKALVDADVAIDIISGTSTGGVNGILLSYALANSNDRELINFSTFSNIWRNSADIIKLLHQQNLFKFQAIDSLFDGEGFYQRELVNAFDRVTANKLPRPQHEWFSESQELDLFITATDYLGKVDRVLDETGAVVAVKSHHALFHLKHRLGRKEAFNPFYRDSTLPRTAQDTYQALAKLCRITSNIPLLFLPIAVNLQAGANIADRQLVLWGNLKQRYLPNNSEQDGYKLYFLDGGLLDNAPFTQALKEMYYRTSDRVVDRKIFYIDPHPEYFTEVGQFPEVKKPSVGQIIHSAVFSMPMDQSITNDWRSIEEHNAKIYHDRTTVERLESAVNSQQFLGETIHNSSEIYLRSRLIHLQNRCLPLLLQLEQGEHPRTYPEVIDKISALLTDKVDRHQHQQKLIKLLRRFEPQVINLDVEYSLRKHFYILQKIAAYLQQSSDRQTQQKLQHLARQLNCNIKLLEVVRASLEILLSDRVVSNYFYYLVQRESNDSRLRALIHELIFRLHRFLLDSTRLEPVYLRSPTGVNLATITPQFWLDLPDFAAIFAEDRWLSQQEIAGAFAQLKQRINTIHHTPDLHKLLWMDRLLEYDGEGNDTFPSLLKQIGIAAEVIIEQSANQYTETLLKQWHNFSCIDRELYPLEYLNHLETKEPIETIRVSPNDAQLGMGKGKSITDKLAGDKLYNRGGLFKKSWRANDLLWGRLDGLNRILEGIITPQSVTAFANLVEREAARNKCSQAAYLDWLLTESLPQLTGKDKQKIRKHLDRLSQPNLQIDSSELRKILDDLVLAGQREILTSDIHYILEGMGENHSRWQFPIPEPRSPQEWILHQIPPPSTSRSSPPGIVIQPKAIHRIEKQSLAKLVDREKNFFRHQYRVLADKIWVNVPLGTVLTLLMRIVLVLRDLLVTTMRKLDRKRFLLNPFYRWLDGNLQSLYWWLQGGKIKLASAHTRPRLLFFQALGLGMAGVSIVMGLLSSPAWLLLSIPGLTSWWFLQTVRIKRIAAAKQRPFLPPSRE